MEWISVKDKMPESGEHVLVACRCGNGWYICDAFHTDEKTEVCFFDGDIDAEYDEETDEYYFPEGWWEDIKNWDEYGCVAIGDTVTHWMPLPKLPEKEGEA